MKERVMQNQCKQTQCGSTLVTVTVLMTIIATLLVIFLRIQSSTLTSFVHEREKLQAIANSRSQALQELQKLDSESLFDTSAINSLFDDDADSSQSLWSSEGFGSATAISDVTPFSQHITVTGVMNTQHANTEIEIASHYTVNDTVVIACSPSQIEASMVRGQTAIFDSDTAVGSLPLNSTGASQAKEWLSSLFENTPPNLNTPLIISSREDFESLEDTVRGDLFFDASWSGLKIDADFRTITVVGDIQFTGSITLKNIKLFTLGEIRLNDKSKLTQSTLFAHGKVFLANESTFSGRLVSLSRIEIFNSSKVEEQSLLLSFAGEKTENKQEEESAVGAINIREQSTVDATCVTLGKEGIMTEIDARSSGILWSSSWIRHRGTHEGLLRSPLFKGEVGTDSPQEVPDSTSVNTKTKQPEIQQITGTVQTPFEKQTYPLPWFIGEPSIILWRESN